jgi:nickel/cobalt transporter (NicO) family protein
MAARDRPAARRRLRGSGWRGAGGMTLEPALVGAAMTIGAVHTCAPDHWVPFAALARAERWSTRRTAAITAMCGLGHVTVSVALGVLALMFGREVFELAGRSLESLSGLLLIGFGVTYALWGMRDVVTNRLHSHAHATGHSHVHLHAGAHETTPAFHQPLAVIHDSLDRSRVTPWSLFVLFSADPCVAVIPLIFASAPLGWSGTLAVVVAYELATIAAMVVVVLPARAAASLARGAWADRYGDALAGGVVALVGIAVMSLGI